MNWKSRSLEYLKTSSMIDKQSTIIIEASLQTDFSYLSPMGYITEKIKNTRQISMYLSIEVK